MSNTIRKISKPTKGESTGELLITYNSVQTGKSPTLVINHKSMQPSAVQVWKPILVINYEDYMHFNNSPLVLAHFGVSLKLQYIRKDGTPGQIRNYRDAHYYPAMKNSLEKPKDPYSKSIIKYFSKEKSRWVDLHELITLFPDLISKDTIPLYFEPGYKRITQICEASVSNFLYSKNIEQESCIEFRELEFHQYSITFIPCIQVKDSSHSDQEVYCFSIFDCIAFGPASFCFISENVLVHVHLTDITLNTLVNRHLLYNFVDYGRDVDSKPCCTSANLLFSAQKSFPIPIELPFKRLRELPLPGKPILELELDQAEKEILYRENYSIRLSLTFAYFSYEVSYSLESFDYEPFVIIDPASVDKAEFRFCCRNTQYEKKCLEIICSYFSSYLAPLQEKEAHDFLLSKISVPENSIHLCIRIPEEEDIFTVMEPLLELGYTLRWKQSKRVWRFCSSPPKVLISSKIDWLEFRIDTTTDSWPYISQLLEDPFQAKNPREEWIVLDKKSLQLIDQLHNNGIFIAPGIYAMKPYQLSNIAHIYDACKTDTPATREFIAKLLKLNTFTGIPAVDLPGGLCGTLRNYQKKGFEWLYFLRTIHLNGCLADDMGLGKTIQTITLIQKIREDSIEDGIKPILITGPVSTLKNWETECRKWAPEREIVMHSGSKRVKNEGFMQASDIIITSYQTLIGDFDLFKTILFDTIILDESQYIKNSNSRTFKTVRSLKALHRLCLTGTPIENSTLELWSQMDFLNPGLLGTRRHFSARYARSIENDQSSSVSEALKKQIHPFILRRTKKEVLAELPEKEVIVEYISMTSDQQKFYEDLYMMIHENLQKASIQDNPRKKFTILLQAILKLRQAALLPHLVSQESCAVSSKFERAKELILQIRASGNKVVLFSQFTGVLHNFETWLHSQTIPYAYLDGKSKHRHEEISRFQNDPDIQIFLISLRAGGTGIHLTAASYVILFDPWWNPAVEAQAIDRCHRIGQHHPVCIYKLITLHTIEEKLEILKERKSKLAKEIITPESDTIDYAKNLTAADFEYLCS